MSLSPTDPGYYTRRRDEIEADASTGWPDVDPSPVVTNRDPRPVDAPADPRAVADLALRGRAAGWRVLVGYSRGFKRAQKIGTYTETETLGVWAGSHPDTRWRWSAMYERKAGTGTWTWTRITIWRDANHFTDASVTDLKDFIEVRGSVLPSWFKAIRTRERDKDAKAKARPKKTKAKEAVN